MDMQSNIPNTQPVQDTPNMQANNNNNKKGLIIGLIVVGVLLVVVVAGIFIFNKPQKDEKATDDKEVNENVDDDTEEDTTDNTDKEDTTDDKDNEDDNKAYFNTKFNSLGEMPNAKITSKNYKQSIEELGCNGVIGYKFSINNGILTITETENNKAYGLNSIKNIKSIVGVSYAQACDMEIYYVLTNDGKIYYTKDYLFELKDLSEIDNFFFQLETTESFTYTDVGVAIYTIDDGSSSYGLIAKTSTGNEIVFTNPMFENPGFYKVK